MTVMYNYSHWQNYNVVEAGWSLDDSFFGP